MKIEFLNGMKISTGHYLNQIKEMRKLEKLGVKQKHFYNY